MTPAKRAQYAAVRSETGTALTQEEHVAGKQSRVQIRLYERELTSIDEETNKNNYGDRTKFIKHCINQYMREKYQTSLPLPKKKSAALKAELAAVRGEAEALKQQIEPVKADLNNLLKTNKAQEKN